MVERFLLPGLWALNFLLHDSFDGARRRRYAPAHKAKRSAPRFYG